MNNWFEFFTGLALFVLFMTFIDGVFLGDAIEKWIKSKSN